MVKKDESRAAERHRRRHRAQSEHGVIKSIPIADEWIKEKECQREGKQGGRYPPAPRMYEALVFTRGVNRRVVVWLRV